MSTAELVVLLDETGSPIGSADKATVHTSSTPLHLAFSCHVLNRRGELLVTRRSLTKQSWPGVWTNSLCGHPAPGEPLENAVVRRGEQELGAELVRIRPVLPDFSYRALDASGIVENEICPVFVADLSGDLAPSAAEVAEWNWVAPEDLAAAVRRTPFAFSPWLVLQLPRLLERDAFALEDAA
ncbi:isopentenyl-diphosphate Delta-isomerase [Leucobacter weissii]|uniref:Isopentenyl-diphosphate Delta-isomerase n=1 Tax=Leucobacter weissii TaxID=1983706 RepID=A0A939MPU1_9MICO|nr:isopentenyl-diphosphate Delta-isomerase [Leucobacter weissii]MBO1902512.1 isopentenyl-diphosphate Delta-isomerase [Leucobacter weissii]